MKDRSKKGSKYGSNSDSKEGSEGGDNYVSEDGTNESYKEEIIGSDKCV